MNKTTEKLEEIAKQLKTGEAYVIQASHGELKKKTGKGKEDIKTGMRVITVIYKMSQTQEVDENGQ